jgi:hypothetical protein
MKNFFNSKIVLICLSVAVVFTACQKENLDETETVVLNEQLPEFDCPNMSANIGDACQDGWGTVSADCDCVENDSEYDCPNMLANIGDPCQDGWGTVSADCDCVENDSEYDCPNMLANIGDPCQDGWGIVTADCDCIEN